MIHALGSQAKFKKVKLNFIHDLADELNFFLLDHDRVQQIAVNLIQNAIKFSYNQSAIKIKLHQAWNQENTLELQVTDNGIGISQADINETVATATFLQPMFAKH